MKFTRWFAILLSFVFGCGIVGVSLVNAATVFPTESSSPTPSVVPFSSESSTVLPGQIFYPAVVAKQKVELYLMNEREQCQQRLHLATERSESAQQLVKMGYTDLAVSTFMKGHQYLAEATKQIQSEGMTGKLQLDTIQKLQDFRQQIEDNKDAFADHQKVSLDQILAENEALLIHLGSQP